MPGEWPVQPLGELVEVLDHLRVPVNSDDRAKRQGDVPYYGANGQQGWIDRPLFDEPLILLAEDGGNLDDFRTRPIAYRIDGPSWVNNHAHIIRAIFGMDQDFVFWSVVHKDIRHYIAGGTRSKLTQGELRSIELSVPPPSEQRRIAEILDTLDEAIRKTEQVIAKLQQMKQGLLHGLLTRGIDEHGELRDPELHPEQFKDSPLGRIPREWEVLPLGTQGSFMNGVNKPKQAFGHGTKFVNISDVYPDRLDTRTLGRVAVTATERGRYGLVPGDVLIDRSSVKLEGVGYPTVFEGVDEPVIFCGFIIRFRPSEADQGLFLCRQMRSRPFRLQVFKIATVSANVNVNQTALSSLLIALPPKAEADRIVAAETAVDLRLRSENERLDKLRTLKHGLMDDLLTGRVRVTVPDEAAA
jgi:type I restriction enzyme S subunit